MTNWNEVSLDQRLSVIGGTIAYTEEVKIVETCLRLAMQRHGTRPDGKIHVVQGETSLGKTTGVKYHMVNLARILGGKFVPQVDLSLPNASVEEADYVQLGIDQGAPRPIIRIQVAPKATYNGLLADTIFALTGNHVSTPSNKHHRLMKLLAEQITGRKTKVLIFDDAHNLARNLSADHAALAADVFKDLAKTARVEIVLIGNAKIAELFRNNLELAGMRDLEFEIAEMPEPLDDTSAYTRFLETFQQQMPFNLPCSFATKADAMTFYKFTRGAPGQTSLTLQLATHYAIEYEFDTVDTHVIGMALYKWKRVLGRDNPFIDTTKV